MEKNEFLGKAPIGKLLFKLAIPTVVAQLVNMLYNIIDRVYIGHMKDVGSLALTGVGVCMPIILIISAFAASYIDVPVETAMAVTFSVSLGIGVLITLVRNISDFGFFQGIFVTLFTIVYVISCIISVVSLISFSFKVIMMMLAVCFGLMIISGLANAKTTRTFVTKDGKTFYEV